MAAFPGRAGFFRVFTGSESDRIIRGVIVCIAFARRPFARTA